MIFLTGEHYVGPWAGLTAQVLLVTSSIASGIAYLNAASRYWHSMGLDGILPRSATRVHPVLRSPSFGNLQAIVTGAAVLVFAVFGRDPTCSSRSGSRAPARSLLRGDPPRALSTPPPHPQFQFCVTLEDHCLRRQAQLFLIASIRNPTSSIRGATSL